MEPVGVHFHGVVAGLAGLALAVAAYFLIVRPLMPTPRTKGFPKEAPSLNLYLFWLFLAITAVMGLLVLFGL